MVKLFNRSMCVVHMLTSTRLALVTELILVWQSTQLERRPYDKTGSNMTVFGLPKYITYVADVDSLSSRNFRTPSCYGKISILTLETYIIKSRIQEDLDHCGAYVLIHEGETPPFIKDMRILGTWKT